MHGQRPATSSTDAHPGWGGREVWFEDRVYAAASSGVLRRGRYRGRVAAPGGGWGSAGEGDVVAAQRAESLDVLVAVFAAGRGGDVIEGAGCRAGCRERSC